MKKLLLLSAAAILACSASAQTLTKVFEYTENIPATRYATGTKGKLYVTDAGKVYSYDATDAKKEYATTTYNVIATDDAGNLIGNNGLYGNSYKQFCIVSATDQSVKNFEVAVPEGITGNKYIHQLGDAVGDVLSAEGGYLTLGYRDNTKGVVIKIVEGEVAETYISDEFDTTVAPKFSNTGKTVPVFTTVAEYASATNPANSFYWRNRSDGPIYKLGTDGATTKMPTPSNAQYNGEGFDVFTLGTTTYAVYPLKKDTNPNSYGDGILIAELETGKEIVTQEVPINNTPANGSTYYYYSSLVAETTADGKANIYVWSNATSAAMYVFDPAGVPTAIESIEAENAPVEYYNLQGVKVANPENGLFIKKQGNKAVKVIL